MGALAVVCLSGLPSEEACAANSKPSPDGGLNWLQLIDGQRFDQSWDQASLFLKEHITKPQWRDILSQQRQPLGPISSRNKMRSEYQYNIPGIGPGTFEITVYRTSFANHTTMDETLILARESDGKWRAIGYYLK
jgi:hypothetical protein